METTVRWITTILYCYFTFMTVLLTTGTLIMVFSDGLSLDYCQYLLYHAAGMVYFEYISKILQEKE